MAFEDAMVKTGNSKWRQPFWFVVLASFTMSFMLLFYLYHSSSLVNDQRLALFANKPAHLFALNNQPIDKDDDDDPPPPLHKTPDDYDSDSIEPQPHHKTMAAIDQDSDEDDVKTGADDDQDVDKSRIDDEEPKIEEGEEEDGDQSSVSVTEEMDEASFDSGTRTMISEPIRERKKIAESPVRKRRVKGNAEKEKNGYGYGDGTITSKRKKRSVGGRGNRNHVESFNAQKKGSVQKRRNRGNAEKARKYDDAKMVPHKLAVDHHKPIPKKKRNRGNAEEVRGTKRVANKKRGSRGNIEELIEIDDAKRVANKKNKKGASQNPRNRGNAEKAGKTGGAKRVVNKLPVDVPHNKLNALKHKKAPKVSEKHTQHVIKKEDEDEEEEQEREEQEQEQDEEEENVKEKEEDGDSDEEEAESVGRTSEGAITEQPRGDDNPITSENDSICRGRYIYIHELPSRFNEDMIKNCKSLDKWLDMCQYLANHGIGPSMNNKLREFTRGAWFDTNQFTLELIFHNRMKQYECLTKDSSKASAIYLPYYSGLDVSRYLWHDKSLKDSAALDLVAWLRDQPEWKRMWGRDHFFVAGRITWDFRREGDNSNNWGNKLMFLPESKNMTILTIESSPWHRNDFAIPYPSYFHPKDDYQVRQRQRLVRKMKRDYLFSFAGGPRPNLPNSVRGEIISQCRAARHKCNLLECVEGDNKCYQPENVMRMFQNSVFCLQPSGDSFTRRSTFDSILAGCIPVFFHPGSAYVQYLWHLPGDFTKYSVYIPGKDVKEGRASIERVLSQIPRAKVVGMREHLIQLIPKITYANPGFKLETKDAFDVAIEGVLGRVEGVREEMMEGRDDSIGFDEEQSWKYYTYGRLGEHEWDDLFDRSKNNSGIERNK